MMIFQVTKYNTRDRDIVVTGWPKGYLTQYCYYNMQNGKFARYTGEFRYNNPKSIISIIKQIFITFPNLCEIEIKYES